MATERWIALAGYMGAGKTTVGRMTADLLGVEFLDADDLVEAHARQPISEIFAQRGELWFRRTEEDLIREHLTAVPGVLALGGGALGSPRTRDLLGREAWVAWLQIAPEVAWNRVGGAPGRPLALDHDRFVRRAGEREHVYREAADVILDGSRAPEDLARILAEWSGDGGPDQDVAG
ncbi:MAG: shikimate kinase [Thermoleophilia bacterium]|nr:shikimate kinase [Thermoleophilia bacterium]